MSVETSCTYLLDSNVHILLIFVFTNLNSKSIKMDFSQQSFGSLLFELENEYLKKEIVTSRLKSALKGRDVGQKVLAGQEILICTY